MWTEGGKWRWDDSEGESMGPGGCLKVSRRERAVVKENNRPISTNSS